MRVWEPEIKYCVTDKVIFFCLFTSLLRFCVHSFFVELRLMLKRVCLQKRKWKSMWVSAKCKGNGMWYHYWFFTNFYLYFVLLIRVIQGFLFAGLNSAWRVFWSYNTGLANQIYDTVLQLLDDRIGWEVCESKN